VRACLIGHKEEKLARRWLQISVLCGYCFRLV
jgi:hypothetical protein